ncbi:hypothetical protein A2U01_0048496, partial [Trifolium medium]|nr:hypothetical protein [Trifolium medium]
MVVVWVLFGFTLPSLLLLKSLFTDGFCCCTALISDSSRSVEICNFLVVGVALVSSFLQDPITRSILSDPTYCGGLGLFGSKGPFMPAVIC